MANGLEQLVAKWQFPPNSHQKVVLEWLVGGKDHACCRGTVRSGKSTLLTWAVLVLDRVMGVEASEVRVVFAQKHHAFNLLAKLGDRWQQAVKPLHNFGSSLLQWELSDLARSPRMKGNKYTAIAQELGYLPRGNRSASANRCLTDIGAIDSPRDFLQAIDLARLTLTDPTPESLLSMVNCYNLDGIHHLEAVAEALKQVLLQGEQQAREQYIFDRTDRLWLPVRWRLGDRSWFQPCQFLILDECEALSPAELALSLMLLGKSGRLLAAGDPYQIPSPEVIPFDSYTQLVRRLGAVEFPLKTCYRCPQSHVELIGQIFAGVAIEPQPEAATGDVLLLPEEELVLALRKGDVVLCRHVAPLVDLCLHLRDRGVAASIQGRELGEQLQAELGAIAEPPEFEYQRFAHFADEYRQFKLQVYEDRPNALLLEDALEDTLAAIFAVHEKHPEIINIRDLGAALDELFSESVLPESRDRGTAITLSTIDTSRYLEGDRVFLLQPDSLLLHWQDQTAEQYQREEQYLYTALTRSRSELFLVGDALPAWFDATAARPSIELPPLQLDRNGKGAELEEPKPEYALPASDGLENFPAFLIKRKESKSTPEAALPEPNPEPNPEVKLEAKPEVKPEVRPEVKPEVRPEARLLAQLTITKPPKETPEPASKEIKEAIALEGSATPPQKPLLGAADDRADLSQLEAEVETHWHGAFHQAGKALAAIRDRGLFRASHSQFYAYCIERFRRPRSKVDALLGATAIVERLKQQNFRHLPPSEAVVRPLVSLPLEYQLEVWYAAVELAGGVPTAAQVKHARDDLLDELQLEPDHTVNTLEELCHDARALNRDELLVLLNELADTFGKDVILSLLKG